MNPAKKKFEIFIFWKSMRKVKNPMPEQDFLYFLFISNG